MSQPNPPLQHHTASPPASYLPLPLAFPSVSGLRGALLGYLGEAENAIRERLGMDLGEGEEPRRGSVTSSTSPSSEDETDVDAHSGPSYTTAVEGSASDAQLRRRKPPRLVSPMLSPDLRDPHSPVPTSPADEMLDSLSKLREDILASVPAVPGLSGWTPNREWLQSLPTRLQAVDLLANGAWPDPVSASHRTIDRARQRVIDIVHSALPPDDWAGWESLGWSSQDGASGSDTGRRRRGGHAKSCSLDQKWGRPEVEDDDDEPEYLFPNRTPGPANAIALRRLKRSRSLGDTDLAIVPSFLDQWIRPVADVSAIVDDEGEADLADIEARAVEAALAEAEDDMHAHEVELPCVKHGAHQVLDIDYVPSVAESLERSHNGTKLLTFNDLPVWWRNNQYIHTA
jgi:adiponectin receptor